MLIVVIQTSTAEIRKEANSLMSKIADRIAPGVWEIPRKGPSPLTLAKQLQAILSPKCRARIIPVCKRCANEQLIWGKPPVTLPPAFVKDPHGHNIPNFKVNIYPAKKSKD